MEEDDRDPEGFLWESQEADGAGRRVAIQRSELDNEFHGRNRPANFPRTRTWNVSTAMPERECQQRDIASSVMSVLTPLQDPPRLSANPGSVASRQNVNRSKMPLLSPYVHTGWLMC